MHDQQQQQQKSQKPAAGHERKDASLPSPATQLQQLIASSPQVRQMRAIQQMADNSIQRMKRGHAGGSGSSKKQGTGSGSAPVAQLVRNATLTVDPVQHNDAVNLEPRNADHAVGFSMPVKLHVDPDYGYAEVADNLELFQYVKDEYTIMDTGANVVDSAVYGNWVRDSYGFDGANGDWNTDKEDTWWTDTPGYVEGQEVQAGNLVSKYEVKFYFDVKDATDASLLHQTNEITLTAESDDNDNVAYDVEDIDDSFQVA